MDLFRCHKFAVCYDQRLNNGPYRLNISGYIFILIVDHDCL